MGVKEYLKEKKESFRKYAQRKGEEKAVREESQRLQAKLDRQAKIEDAKIARKELAEIAKEKRAERDIAKLESYQREEKRKRSVIGKIGTGIEKGIIGFSEGVDKIQASQERMFGKPPSRKSNDLFGGDMGMDIAAPSKRKGRGSMGSFGGWDISLDSGMFSDPPPKKKRKKKSKKKGRSKTIIIKA